MGFIYKKQLFIIYYGLQTVKSDSLWEMKWPFVKTNFMLFTTSAFLDFKRRATTATNILLFFPYTVQCAMVYTEDPHYRFFDDTQLCAHNSDPKIYTIA